MTSMFIEVTPRLIHFDGTTKELGTVRYSIDEKVWPPLQDGAQDYNALQQLTNPVALGNEGWSKIDFKVVFIEASKPQGMQIDAVSAYPKIQTNAQYGANIKGATDTEVHSNGEAEPLRSEWDN